MEDTLVVLFRASKVQNQSTYISVNLAKEKQCKSNGSRKCSQGREYLTDDNLQYVESKESSHLPTLFKYLTDDNLYSVK